MKNCALLLLYLSVSTVCGSSGVTRAPIEKASPGSPRFVVRTDPSWDSFTAMPEDSVQTWFRSHVWRMMVYSPYFDSRLSWYPNGWIYINLYAIPVNSTVVKEHPDWILRDADGRPLFIPYACRGGSCPQYAADISNSGFREAWLHKAAMFKHLGYKGFWIDDVNLVFRVSNGDGRFQGPVLAGKEMSEKDWRENVASFVEQIRRTFPDTEILHNSIWFAGGTERDKSAEVQRQLAACDYVNIERGVTDSGLKGGTGEWSLNALLSFVDRLHRVGKAIVLDNTGEDYSYGLAGFYLISSGIDALGSHSLRPDRWPASLSQDLGTPIGDRTDWKGLLIRRFSGGLAVVNPPGSQYRRITLLHELHNVDNSSGQTVDLKPASGLVAAGSVRADLPLEELIRIN